jgi:hypothetical protein
MTSLAAAPDGPNTGPPRSRKAASIVPRGPTHHINDEHLGSGGLSFMALDFGG